MNSPGTAQLPLRKRLKLREVEAVEELALAVIPHGTLRRRLLNWVDREFERIGHLVGAAEQHITVETKQHQFDINTCI